MRDALSLLDQCLSTKDTVTVENVAELLGSADSDCTFRVAEAILSQDAAGAIDGFNDFLAAGGDCRVFAADLSLHLRDLIVAHHAHNAAQVLDVSADTAARLIKQAKAHAPGDILRALGELIELDGALRYAANPRIPVELALLRCCRMEQPGSYEALLTRVERLEKQLQNGVATAPFAQPVDKAPIASPTEEQKTPARSVPETSKAKEEPKGSPKLVPEAPKAQEGAKPPVDDLPPWEVPPPTEEPSRAPAPVEDIPPWEEASPPPAPSRPMGGSALARAAATLSGLPEQETPKAEKEAKQPAEEGTKPPGDANAAKLWRNVVDGLNRKGLPHLVGFAGKGRRTAWDGETLTVSFTQDDRGSADMLEAAHMGLHVGQMTSQAAMRQCFDAVTVNPARLLGLEGYGIAPGYHADFVLLHARNPVDAIRLRAQRLGVWRRGRRVAGQPAPIAELCLAGRPGSVDFL